MKEHERHFFETSRRLTGVKNKSFKISRFTDTVFETKVITTRPNVCLLLLNLPTAQELNIASHVRLQNDHYSFKAFIFFLSINTV